MLHLTHYIRHYWELFAAAVREQRADGELLRAAGRRMLRGAGVGRVVVGRAGRVRRRDVLEHGEVAELLREGVGEVREEGGCEE